MVGADVDEAIIVEVERGGVTMVLASAAAELVGSLCKGSEPAAQLVPVNVPACSDQV